MHACLQTRACVHRPGRPGLPRGPRPSPTEAWLLEQGQPAVGAVRAFARLALPQGSGWGNACLPGASFLRGAGLQTRVSLTAAGAADGGRGGLRGIQVGPETQVGDGLRAGSLIR